MEKQVATPYFLIEENLLQENIENLKTGISLFFPQFIIGYSFKTNALPWLIGKLHAEGFFAEVVSADEYELARLLGFPIKQIIYNGPAKNEESFIEAVTNGAIVNLETHRELRWLESIKQKNLKVGLRIQVDVESYCPGETVNGQLGGRFGFQLDELPQILKQLERLEVSLAGIHVHTSSKTRSVNIYHALASEAARLIHLYNWHLTYLDIGGGFFGGVPDKPSFTEYFEVIYQSLASVTYLEELQLIVEPGASIIASPVSLVTSVIDTKKTPHGYFVTTDGSRTNIDPFFLKTYYEVTFERQTTSIAESELQAFKQKNRQIISGFTCMENDQLFVLENQPLFDEGDRIIYHKVGSYTMCFNPLFIQYLPAVYVKRGNKLTQVRSHWTAREYIQRSEEYK
ncbi:MAG: hypothetical protein ACK5NA_00980 [Enterococcus sp.]